MRGQKAGLRAIEPTDVDIIHRWENDRDIWRLSNTVAPYSRHLIEQYVLNAGQDIYSARQLRLIIERVDKPDHPAVGAIDLFDFDPMHRRAGVGILIDPCHRSEGLASEALQLLINYAFETLQLHQLYCNITPDNEASLRLFQKSGFCINGTKKEWLSIGGRWTDEYFLQCMNPNQ